MKQGETQKKAHSTLPRLSPSPRKDHLSNVEIEHSPHRPQFIAARDSRNRRVPGLYVRNGRYYAQLWVDLGNGKKSARRFPLLDGDRQPARNLQGAKEALEIKRHDRRENKLPTTGYKPRFADYWETYFEK